MFDMPWSFPRTAAKIDVEPKEVKVVTEKSEEVSKARNLRKSAQWVERWKKVIATYKELAKTDPTKYNPKLENAKVQLEKWQKINAIFEGDN